VKEVDIMADFKHAGRPRSYMPEDFRAKVIEYFESVDKENERRKLQRFMTDKVKPYTISGICVYLGISRDTWSEYGKQEGYSDTIKIARLIVENYVEEGLLNGSVNPIGAIFNLKNNFDWVDKRELTVGQAEPPEPTPELLEMYRSKIKLLEQMTGT